MRTAPNLAVIALAIGLALTSNAFASEDEGCTKAPKEQWLTLEQLKSKLTEQGYKVKEIEFEDGCAEADVEDKNGTKSELKLDPVTASVVKSEDS
ncbi:MAG: PepSY domain-containing protein [Hyphomicrobiaceae bacterium]